MWSESQEQQRWITLSAATLGAGHERAAVSTTWSDWWKHDQMRHGYEDETGRSVTGVRLGVSLITNKNGGRSNATVHGLPIQPRTVQLRTSTTETAHCSQTNFGHRASKATL